jgi:hypothetical protein
MNGEEEVHVALIDKILIICLILTKMVACTVCRIRCISILVQAHGFRLETWRMQREPILMREKPKANTSV